MFAALLFATALVAPLTALPIVSQYNIIQTPTFAAPLLNPGVNPAIIPASQPVEQLAHPAAVENAAAESQLPQELLNPFYKNPGIAAALAKESWFSNKEFPVHHREAEKIPRSEIFKIISRLQHRR
ncbi:hypothetical protein Zmor_028276 [Zophobas morio]|uniref:Uncharacterized protein n=1 Tax=Zophobas morio TaxID=2755281 RepID=A0AA38HQ85_9CUCU|nr:hypothetical protein Zmor_028276 [Zophobas morio]